LLRTKKSNFKSDYNSLPPPTVSSEPRQAPLSEECPALKPLPQVLLETQGNPQDKAEEHL